MNKGTTIRRAFTLIELLTVVAIIAILVGLLFPAIGSAIKRAERAKAQATVTGLAVAFKGYYNEFGRWGTNVSASAGNVTTGVFANARGTVLYDFPAKDIDSSGNFVDPWRQPYRFQADPSYSGTVSVSGTNVAGGIAVWSKGPDGTEYNADDVKSW